MRLWYSRQFLRSFRKAPPNVQSAFGKQITLLLQNIRHPSLHAKKYDAAKDMWQARVNKSWRFYFTIEGDAYHLHDIMAHPK